MKENIGLFLLCILFGLHNLFAQSTTGNIEGWIFNTDNQPVAGVNILLISPDFLRNIGITTDKRGYFQISLIPAGIYSIRISHSSYQKIIINNVHVLRLGVQKERYTYSKFESELIWNRNEINLITMSISGNPFTVRHVDSPILEVINE